jgi:hypothetical protein
MAKTPKVPSKSKSKSKSNVPSTDPSKVIKTRQRKNLVGDYYEKLGGFENLSKDNESVPTKTRKANLVGVLDQLALVEWDNYAEAQVVNKDMLNSDNCNNLDNGTPFYPPDDIVEIQKFSKNGVPQGLQSVEVEYEMNGKQTMVIIQHQGKIFRLDALDYYVLDKRVDVDMEDGEVEEDEEDEEVEEVGKVKEVKKFMGTWDHKYYINICSGELHATECTKRQVTENKSNKSTNLKKEYGLDRKNFKGWKLSDAVMCGRFYVIWLEDKESSNNAFVDMSTFQKLGGKREDVIKILKRKKTLAPTFRKLGGKRAEVTNAINQSEAAVVPSIEPHTAERDPSPPRSYTVESEEFSPGASLGHQNNNNTLKLVLDEYGYYSIKSLKEILQLEKNGAKFDDEANEEKGSLHPNVDKGFIESHDEKLDIHVIGMVESEMGTTVIFQPHSEDKDMEEKLDSHRVLYNYLSRKPIRCSWTVFRAKVDVKEALNSLETINPDLWKRLKERWERPTTPRATSRLQTRSRSQTSGATSISQNSRATTRATSRSQTPGGSLLHEKIDNLAEMMSRFMALTI